MKKAVEKNVTESTEIINNEEQIFLMDNARYLCKTLMRTVRTIYANKVSQDYAEFDNDIKEFTAKILQIDNNVKLLALCKVLTIEEKVALLDILNKKEN